jgi:rSAM/selenodomain-associated transferase 2
MISVIIPVLNEQEALARLLPQLEGLVGVETIVVDGGSDDYSCDLAAVHADRVISSDRGRAIQMNSGAHCASGDILLFLHADSRLPAGWQTLIEGALQDRRVVGGAFDLELDDERLPFSIIGRVASFRSRLLKTPYGDQGIFVRTALFNQLGGYSAIPIMEDVEFARRLRKAGKLVFLDRPLVTSARKWRQHGIFRTTAAHWLVSIGFYLRLSPQRLLSLYTTVISKHQLKNSR